MKEENKILVLGIGNIGRQDDGMGWLFLDYLQEINPVNFDLEFRYQLQIEDAELIGNYKTVIFIDATKENVRNGFYFKTCKPSNINGFSSHELSPETILFLAKSLYQCKPESYVLGIQGYDWDLKIGISDGAKANFEMAKIFLTNQFELV